MNSTQQQISDLQKTLADLNKTYEEAMERKRVIEEETSIMERRKIGESPRSLIITRIRHLF